MKPSHAKGFVCWLVLDDDGGRAWPWNDAVAMASDGLNRGKAVYLSVLDARPSTRYAEMSVPVSDSVTTTDLNMRAALDELRNMNKGRPMGPGTPDALRVSRRAARMTQEQLAEAAGVSLRSMQDYEATALGNSVRRASVLAVALWLLENAGEGVLKRAG